MKKAVMCIAQLVEQLTKHRGAWVQVSSVFFSLHWDLCHIVLLCLSSVSISIELSYTCQSIMQHVHVHVRTCVYVY